MLDYRQIDYRFASRFLQYFVYNMKCFQRWATGGPPVATVKAVNATSVVHWWTAIGFQPVTTFERIRYKYKIMT